MGMEVLPPDINKSGSDFTPDGSNIRFGLASVKNVGEGVVEEVVKGREEEKYKSFYDFCTKVELKQFNKRTLESLIKAGAFVSIEKSRKQLLENFDSAMNTAIRENEAKASGQMNLFAMMAGGSAPTFVLSGSSEEEFPDSEVQGFEKELLGFYVTSHPLSGIKDQLPFLTTHNISELKDLREGALVTICGLISSIRLITTKTGKMLKVGTIEDLTGNTEFVAYSEILNKFGEFLEPESKVIIGGKLQHRGDEEISVSVMINNVSKVENCNIVNIDLSESMKFEEIIALKDLLIENKGTDPVVFNVGNNGSAVKILASSNYWVRASNDLQSLVKTHFKSDLEISSLDCS
jgi:DNA polymerase-3 subunit alpha